MSEQDIKDQNLHWFNKDAYNFKLKRKMYTTLEKELSYKHITGITGPRRVGKTILIKQIIAHLIKSRVPKENILYFSFDEINSENSIKLLMRDWEKILGKDYQKEKYIVFIDEIQNVNRWAEQLKTYYDLYENNIKFFISGSASLNIKKGQESLAGRLIEFFVGPLDYDEYLTFSEKPKLNLENYYNDYLYNQLPALALRQEDKRKYTESIVKKVIYEDAVKYYNIDNPNLLDSLFKIIVRKPGQIINYDDLANDLGASRNTLPKYFEVLEKSYLVRKVYNYSNNTRKIEKKSKKFYPYFTTLFNYIFPQEIDIGELTETVVAQKINAEFFHNLKNKEIDFIIIKENNYKIGLEVKAKNHIVKKDIKYLLENKLHLNKLILVTLPNSILGFEQKDLDILTVLDLITKGI